MHRQAGNTSRSTPVARSLALAAALAAGYGALYVLVSEITAFGSTTGSTFWPGAGLTFAALVRSPRRRWPLLLLAVGLTEAALDVRYGFGLLTGIGWGVANTAEPALAALLITRGGRSTPDLSRLRELSRFWPAILAGPLLGALIGTAVGALGGDPVWPRLPRWFVGDAIGVLVVAPALLAVRSGDVHRLRVGPAWPLGLLAATAAVSLGPWQFPADVGLPFLVVPVLGIVAVRQGVAGAAIGTLFVAVIVETVTALGEGPFSHAGAFDGLVVAQMFLAMAAVASLTAAALRSDLVSRDELEAKLREQALHDSLTGLANRRLLSDRLDLACRELELRPGMVTLTFIDLDDFKTINDRYGHAAGDAVLIEIANRLTSMLRDEDTVARLGGDEFLMIARVRNEAAARALAERALAAVSVPVEVGEHSIPIRASAGISMTDVAPPDLEAFIGAADRAMYAAKRAGGGRAEPARPLLVSG